MLDQSAATNPAQPTGLTEGFAQDAFTAAELTYRPQGVGSQEGLPKDWKSVPPPPGLENDFKTAICDHLVSPAGDHYVAFRGTIVDSVVDWKNNFQQGASMESEQYESAARIAEHFRENRDKPGYDFNVSYTGHSLGGGKAQLAAEVASLAPNSGGPKEPQVCVAINAAPVHRETYEKHGCDPHRHSCTTLELENENDALTVARDLTPTVFGTIAQTVNRNVGPVVGAAATVATTAASYVPDSVKTATSTVAGLAGSGIAATASGAASVLKTVAGYAASGVSGVASAAGTIASGTVNGISAAATGATSVAKSAAGLAASGLSAAGSAMPESVKNAASYVANTSVAKGAAGYVSAGAGVVSNAASGIASAGANAVSTGATYAANNKGKVALTAASAIATGLVYSNPAGALAVGTYMAGTTLSALATGAQAVGSAGLATASALGPNGALLASSVAGQVAQSSADINAARTMGDRYQVKLAGSGAILSKDPASGHYMKSFDTRPTGEKGPVSKISCPVTSIAAFGALTSPERNTLDHFDQLKPPASRLLNAAVNANSRGSQALERTNSRQAGVGLG